MVICIICHGRQNFAKAAEVSGSPYGAIAVNAVLGVDMSLALSALLHVTVEKPCMALRSLADDPKIRSGEKHQSLGDDSIGYRCVSKIGATS